MVTTTETRAYTPPQGLVLTPAMRAEDDAWRDQRAARARQDQAGLDEWLAEARERVLGPLDAWLEAAP